MKKNTFLSLILTLFLATNIFATDYYVSATGDDANNGTSLATAFATIGKAIMEADTDGDTIYIHETIVTDQTYNISVSLNFRGIGDSDLGRIKDDVTQTRTDGFFNVTTPGKTITFQDLVFQERIVPPTVTGVFPMITLLQTYGGVISMTADSTLNFTFCLFLGNLASDGGAIYFNAGNVTIDTCGFYSNAANTGGAINAAGSGTLDISIALFDGNGNVQVDDGSGGMEGAFDDYNSETTIANYGGAIAVHESHLSGFPHTPPTVKTSISNTVFAENLTEDAGGALYFGGEDGTGILEKSTVYKNTVTDPAPTNGGGISITSPDGPRSFTILNSLIYGNTVNGTAIDSDISLDTQVSATIINTLAGEDLNNTSTGTFTSINSNLTADLSSSNLEYETAEASEADGFGTITNENRHVIFTAPATMSDDTPIDFGGGEDVGEWDSEITIFRGANTDWASPANWPGGSLPKATDNITIIAGSNQPVIGSTTGAVANNLVIDNANGASLTIESGGSLILSGDDSEGYITYNVAIPNTDWHLASSPVVGETYDDTWISDNSIVSGSVNNRGIATYDNSSSDTTTAHWRYFQAGSAATTFDSGIGYSTKRDAAGNYSFTGTVSTSNVSPAISQGVNNWNLLGNPYPSYVDILGFMNTNRTKITDAFEAIYVWNPTAGTGEYQPLTTGYLHPGQGFFINSDVASSTASITEAMQSHRTGATFYRTNNTDPSINLMISDDTASKNTQINYLEGKTKGLDPGFDLGMFNGTSSNLRLYTHLIEDNQGIGFAIQALPNSDLESMIVPVGVKAGAGKEITFSVNALNLPTDLKVFLEDRVANTFTRLDEANTEYTVTLSEALDGVGRFYVHTSASALTVDDAILNTISIYKSDVSTLRIAGLPQGNTTVKLYNILGKELIDTTFDTDGVIKDISLPKLATGVYIIDVQTATGKLNKKIILE